MNNMEWWDKLKDPPASALKKIEAGRLKGKSDISPQWRYQAMTEVFGPCGIGWKFTIDKLWNEPTCDEQVFAFAVVSVYVKTVEGWSEPIPGAGGSMLTEKEKAGLHASDEGYKMAITDALGTAMKMLGVAASVFLGQTDGSKYSRPTTPTVQQQQATGTTAQTPANNSEPSKDQQQKPKKEPATDEQLAKIADICMALADKTGKTPEEMLKLISIFPGKDGDVWLKMDTLKAQTSKGWAGKAIAKGEEKLKELDDEQF